MCRYKERVVDESKPTLPFTQQLLDQADAYRQQARDLRAPTSMLTNPPPNAEANRLDALADQLTTKAIE